MTKFGFSQITVDTPLWAKWLFRIIFLLTSAVTIWLAGTGLVSDAIKLEVALVLKVVDVVAFGVSKLFGVDVSGEVSPSE